MSKSKWFGTDLIFFTDQKTEQMKMNGEMNKSKHTELDNQYAEIVTKHTTAMKVIQNGVYIAFE